MLAETPTVPSTESSRRTREHDAWLVYAAGFFAVAVVLHNADHLRRGADAVSREVFWLGTAGIALEVAIVVLVCQRHRTAPLAAAVTGFGLAAGYLIVHFLPWSSPLSDSFTSGSDVSPMSWIAASLEVVAAVTLACVGLVVVSRRGGLASAARPNPAQRSLRDAMLHPVALVFALSQAVTLVISFAQL